MPSPPIRVGLLGCGVIGSGLLHLLHERSAAIDASVGAALRVVAVAVSNPKKPRDANLSGIEITDDALGVAARPDLDVLVELIGGA